MDAIVGFKCRLCGATGERAAEQHGHEGCWVDLEEEPTTEEVCRELALRAVSLAMLARGQSLSSRAGRIVGAVARRYADRAEAALAGLQELTADWQRYVDNAAEDIG